MVVYPGDYHKNDVRSASFLPDRGLSADIHWTIASVLGSMIICTVVGNLLVMSSFVVDKKLRTFNNWTIFSLAVADVVVGAVVMPMTLLYDLSGQWRLGHAACLLWQFLDALNCSSSILNTCLIGVLRYWCVARPLRYSILAKRPANIGAMIAGVWVVSAATSVPLLLPLSQPHGEESATRCYILDRAGFIVYSSTVTFFIPVALMSTITVAIYRQLLSRKRRVDCRRQQLAGAGSELPSESRRDATRVSADANSRPETSNRPPGPSNEPPHSPRVPVRVTPVEDPNPPPKPSNRPPQPPRTSLCVTSAENVAPPLRSRSAPPRPFLRCPADSLPSVSHTSLSGHPPHLSPVPARFRRAARRAAFTSGRSDTRRSLLMLTIALGIVVCWSPFYIIYVVRPFCKSYRINPHLITASNWLGYFNSLLNPVIYACLNNNFKNAFRRIIKCQ